MRLAKWNGVFMRSTRGFTLIELVIVAALIAVIGSIVFATFDRRRENVTLDRAGRDFQARIGKVRALAESVGSRLGPQANAGPDRFINCGGGGTAPPGPTNELMIGIDPVLGTYTVPERVDIIGGTDDMQSTCTTYDIPSLTSANGTAAQIASATGATAFEIAFTSMGRVNAVLTTAAVANLHFRVERSSVDAFGFRVLPSGILCEDSRPSITGQVPACDEYR